MQFFIANNVLSRFGARAREREREREREKINYSKLDTGYQWFDKIWKDLYTDNTVTRKRERNKSVTIL